MTDNEMLSLYRTPDGVTDVIMDCDTYNEIDDQFAIAYALKNKDRLNVKGFTIAPFRKSTRVSTIAEGLGKSYEETEKVLALCGEKGYAGKIFMGNDKFLTDEKTPEISAAAEFIIETSKSYTKENPLYIAATGAITNVASAIIADPSVADRTCVVWIAGNSFDWWSNKEYNMKQDIAAARAVMNSGVPFVQIPGCGVTSEFITTRVELEHYLKGKNPLCDYLCDNCITYVEKSNKFKTWSKVIWDVVVPAWFLNDNDVFMCGRIENRRLPSYGDFRYEEAVGRKMFYVHQIKRDALMSDLFSKLTGENL